MNKRKKPREHKKERKSKTKKEHGKEVVRSEARRLPLKYYQCEKEKERPKDKRHI